MNRSERRRNEIKKKEATYVLNETQIEILKEEAVQGAADKVFALMLAIPVMILHDKYWIKSSKQKIPKFVEQCMDLYEMHTEGLVSIEDLINCLEEESGIKIMPQEK